MLISIGCGASTGSVLNQPESIWKYKLLWSLQILCAVVICGERLDSHLFMVDPFFFWQKPMFIGLLIYDTTNSL
jgi:hypothetical protein